jgi:HD superfamily phosphohydrolase
MPRAATSKKELRDAVHGDILVDPYELDVINTPQFQRMRGIRQLGLAHLVFPGAQHSRFEHSIGVAHMASQIVRAIRENGGEISDDELRLARIVGLVHDIGHVPFGHTLEDERPIYPPDQHHDESSRLDLFLRKEPLHGALTKLGETINRRDLIADIIRLMGRTHDREDGPDLNKRETLVASIVGNTICADLLDYLKRDPYFTGIRHSYDEKFISTFEVADDSIYLNLTDEASQLRRGVLSEITHLLRLRYTLGERVYYHLTKSAASAMVSKAVELSGIPHTVLSELRDEELLYILENAKDRSNVSGLRLQNAEQVRQLALQLRARRLYVPVYTITRSLADHHLIDLCSVFHDANNASKRAEIEDRIAKEAGLRSGQVIIYCPDEKMSTKAAMVNVLWPKEAAPAPLEVLCDRHKSFDDETTKQEIESLKRKHMALWQLTVFVDGETTRHQRGEVFSSCEDTPEFFGIQSHYEEYRPDAAARGRRRVVLAAVSELDPNAQLSAGKVQDLLTGKFISSGDSSGALNVEQVKSLLREGARRDAGGQQQLPLDGPDATS